MSLSIRYYYFNKKLAFRYACRSQAPLCLMLREPKDGVLDIVAANEYRAEKRIRFAVSDLETEQVLASGEATLPPNGLAELGCVPFEPVGNRYYLLELFCEGATYLNHYVSGGIPFSVKQYETMLKKANIL